MKTMEEWARQRCGERWEHEWVEQLRTWKSYHDGLIFISCMPKCTYQCHASVCNPILTNRWMLGYGRYQLSGTANENDDNDTRMNVNGDDVRTNGSADNVRSGNAMDGRVGTPAMRRTMGTQTMRT